MPIFPSLVWRCGLQADGMAAGLPLNRKRSERAAKVSLKHHEGRSAAAAAPLCKEDV